MMWVRGTRILSQDTSQQDNKTSCNFRQGVAAAFENKQTIWI